MRILKIWSASIFAARQILNRTDMKTKLTIIVLMIIIPLMTGCKEGVKSDCRSAFTITLYSQYMSGDTSRIRFNQIKKKDEKTLAMERMSCQWNRNLYLMGGCQSLDEYADSCGAQNGW